jgi:DNA-binding MurR/RpiR family transcriptional regulator
MTEISYHNLIEVIREAQDSLTPRKQRLARYILANYRKAAFFTATQLGRAAGVSQPTVVRFCQHLGFQGYPSFVETLQKLVRHELTTIERFQMSLNESEQPVSYPQRLLIKEMQNLRELAENFPTTSFERAVSQIVEAGKIFVIGMRGSAALAQFLAYFLRKVKRPVYALTQGGTQDYDLLLEMNSRDVAVALAFPRYPRETIEMARLLHRRGMQMIAITDSKGSPLHSLAAIRLIVPISFTTLFDSYAAPLCLLNMLVTEVGRANTEESRRLLDEFESLAREIRVFHRGHEAPKPTGGDG